MDDRRRAFRYRRPSSWAAGRPPPGNCLSAARAVLAAGAVVIGAAMALVATSGPAYGRRRRGARAVHHASRMVLRTLGVRIELTGAPPVGASLVVANHVCWLDALVLAAAAPMVPVAGAEVDGWPVIGVLARRIGTVFVRQGEPRALPVDIENMTATLRAGHRVQVFPEGATWGAGALGKFRRAAFQAAVDAAVVVSPVALGYRDANGRPTTVGAFAGAGNRAASVRTVLGHRPAIAIVHWLPVIPAVVGTRHRATDRAIAARRAECAIARALVTDLGPRKPGGPGGRPHRQSEHRPWKITSADSTRKSTGSSGSGTARADTSTMALPRVHTR